LEQAFAELFQQVAITLSSDMINCKVYAGMFSYRAPHL